MDVIEERECRRVREREGKRTKEERKRVKTEQGETRDDGGTLMRSLCYKSEKSTYEPIR